MNRHTGKDASLRAIMWLLDLDLPSVRPWDGIGRNAKMGGVFSLETDSQSPGVEWIYLASSGRNIAAGREQCLSAVYYLLTALRKHFITSTIFLAQC